MTEPRQAGTLARTHEGQPGLPRGRSSLPPQDVRASQRQQLPPSVIAVVSESGYYSITVANIVRRARVFPEGAFYEHFANKEECFLTATGQGRELMLARAASAAQALPAGAAEEDLLRAAIHGYLEFLADKQAFARVFYLHMPAAGRRPIRPGGSTPGRGSSRA